MKLHSEANEGSDGADEVVKSTPEEGRSVHKLRKLLYPLSYTIAEAVPESSFFLFSQSYTWCRVTYV